MSRSTLRHQNSLSLLQWGQVVGIVLVLCMHGSIMRGARAQPAEARQEPAIHLSGEVELSDLVDLCASRLQLNIEYDASVVRGTVTLRLEGPLSDDDLWRLTSRILAARQLTTVEIPGSESNRSLSIVKVTDAPGLAALRPPENAGAAGYLTVAVQLRHRSSADVVDLLKGVLSRSGSSLLAIDSPPVLLISDLRPRIDLALELLEQIDVPAESIILERYRPLHYSASQLATSVTALLSAREAVQGQPLQGRILAEPAGDALILVAAPADLPLLRAIVQEYDRDPLVEMRSYTPRYFGIQEVASLIEARIRSDDGGTARWNIVRDELTGTLLITATPKQHAAIEALVSELNAMPQEARRPLRVFPVRNRSVEEILQVVQALLEQGALQHDVDAAEAPDNTPTSPAALSNSPLADTPPDSPDRSGTEGETRPGTSGRAMPHPPGSAPVTLTADLGTNSILAVGEPRLLGEIEDLIRRLDIRQPQVLLEVLLISLSEGQTLDLGVELEKFELSGDTLVTLSSLFGLSDSADDGGRSVEDGRGGTVVVLSPGDFNIVVRALQTINHGRTLNIPKVLVGNHQQAQLDSVLKQPFTATNASDTVATTSFGGTEDAGTQVTLTPHIAEGDHLVVEYTISLSAFVGESADPALPPPRQENSLQSSATVPDGFTIALGGLWSQNSGTAVSQVPLLGSIPGLGELFKSRSNSQSDSRFFVFIRPRILRQARFEDLKYLSRQERDTIHEPALQDVPELSPQILY